MNPLDILICVILGFCLIRGIFRGSIKEITAIIGVFVGFYVAYSYYSVLATWLSEYIVNESYRNIVSFFLAFAIFFFAIGLIGALLKHLLKGASLGWTDRALGSILGLVKALLIVSILLIPITTYLPKNSPVIRNSVLAPYVSMASDKIIAVVPKDMKQRFWNNVKALRTSWKKV
jgi:membrane protein required for colicin V production